MNSYSSSNKTSSGAVKSGPGLVHTVVLTAAADAATLILYDSLAGSGTVICKLAAPIGGTAYARLDVPFSTGCYAALTGTGPNATVTFW